MKVLSTIEKLMDKLERDGKVKDFGADKSAEHRKKIDETIRSYELEKKLRIAKDKDDLSKHMLAS